MRVLSSGESEAKAKAKAEAGLTPEPRSVQSRKLNHRILCEQGIFPASFDDRFFLARGVEVRAVLEQQDEK